jgi:hypothetical protein
MAVAAAKAADSSAQKSHVMSGAALPDLYC